MRFLLETKKEDEQLYQLYKDDLARYLKNDFAKYKPIADKTNQLYRNRCWKEGRNKPLNISEYKSIINDRDKLCWSIQRKLPKPDDFDCVYRAYNSLLKSNKINLPITHQDVINFINNGIKIGSIRSVGTRFKTQKRPEDTYEIIGFNTDANGHNTLKFKNVDTLQEHTIACSLFQNHVKDGKVTYI